MNKEIDDAIKGIGFALAIVHARKDQLTKDHKNYRRDKYKRAQQILLHILDRYRTRWDHLNAQEAEWMSILQRRTPPEQIKRLKRSQIRYRLARERYGL